MGTLLNHVRWFLLGVIVLTLAGAVACSPGGGGHEATPGASGSEPIAVEIPAITDISDIVYVSGPVVAATSGSLSSKAVSPFKVTTVGTYDEGKSLNACQTANLARGSLKNAAHPDLMICLMKNYVTPIYDGNDHDAAIWISKESGTGLAKFRFNITRNSDDFITQFTIYTCVCADSQCSSSVQTEYIKQVFGQADNSVTITTKDDEGDYTASMAVTGTLNTSAQYLTKSVAQSDWQVSGSVTRTQSSTMVQDATTATIDGFQRSAGTGTHDTRVYSYLGFTYTGDPAADLDLALYDIGAGAGRLIDDIFDQTQCWGGDGQITAFPCPPYSDAITGKDPMAVTDVAPVHFVPGENDYIDCSTVHPTTTIGSETDPIVLGTSKCSGFKDLESHMDCYADIYGDFTVTATAGGLPLSTNSNRPSHVGASPTILLTTNYTPGVGSFSSNTIKLAWDGACQEPWTDAAFASSNWSSAATAQNPEAQALALHPTLCDTVYTLTLDDDLSGINLDSIAAPQVYYITP